MKIVKNRKGKDRPVKGVPKTDRRIARTRGTCLAMRSLRFSWKGNLTISPC